MIEVDGGYHNTMEQMWDDTVRTDDIEKTGYTVIRFTNEDVEMNLPTVMTEKKRIV